MTRPFLGTSQAAFQYTAAEALALVDAQAEHNQQRINRLMAHLRQHCPELTGEGVCGYQEEIRGEQR